jgi:hypothetical protein
MIRALGLALLSVCLPLSLAAQSAGPTFRNEDLPQTLFAYNNACIENRVAFDRGVFDAAMVAYGYQNDNTDLWLDPTGTVAAKLTKDATAVSCVIVLNGGDYNAVIGVLEGYLLPSDVGFTAWQPFESGGAPAVRFVMDGGKDNTVFEVAQNNGLILVGISRKGASQ